MKYFNLYEKNLYGHAIWQYNGFNGLKNKLETFIEVQEKTFDTWPNIKKEEAEKIFSTIDQAEKIKRLVCQAIGRFKNKEVILLEESQAAFLQKNGLIK